MPSGSSCSTRDASSSRDGIRSSWPPAASTRASGACSSSRTSWPVHDDEVLGRAYDARLMRRVWGVARPHRRLVFLSLALFPATAGLELLQPYLVKVAIDDYILMRDWTGLGA